jgi:hypothetical protein
LIILLARFQFRTLNVENSDASKLKLELFSQKKDGAYD